MTAGHCLNSKIVTQRVGLCAAGPAVFESSRNDYIIFISLTYKEESGHENPSSIAVIKKLFNWNIERAFFSVLSGSLIRHASGL